MSSLDEEPTREMRPRITSASTPSSETQPSAPEPPPPEIPGFTILSKLGQGGQGAVYLAESQDGLSKRAAVKVFPREAKASYARELEAWRRVEEIRRASGTPHLVEGYSAGSTPDGHTFVAMAFFERGSLADRLIADGPLEPQDGVRFARHVLSALELLHRYGLFHRDVKPQNVFLGSDGIARLGDYGLSKQLGTSVTGSCTPAFAAPEQLAGEEDADGKKIDIYGVGATLFALLTGKAPVPGRPDVFLLERRKVPRAIHAALFRALSPYPHLRFDEAAEFAKALAQAEPGAISTADDVVLAAGEEASERLRLLATAETVALDSDRKPPPRKAAPEAAGTTAGRRTGRARALLGVAALLCALPFVADALRDPHFVKRKEGKDGGEIAHASTASGTNGSNHGTPVVSGSHGFSLRRGPVSLEGVRHLASSDQGVALVSSGSVSIFSGSEDLLVFETPLVERAVPYGAERALVATRAGDLVLASAVAGEAPLSLVRGEGRRPLALGAHAATRQVAFATGTEGVSWFRLEADGHVRSTCLLTEVAGVVTDVAFDERGERLAVAGIAPDGAGKIAVYRLWRGDPWVETALEASGPLAVAWLSRTAIAVGDVHGDVAIVDARNGTPIRTLAAAAFEVIALARSPRGDALLVLADDRKLEPGKLANATWIQDAEGGTLSFPKKRRGKLLAFRPQELLSGAGEPAPLPLDPTSFDPAAFR